MNQSSPIGERTPPVLDGAGLPGARRGFFDLWSHIYDLPIVQWTTYHPIHRVVMRELRRRQCRRVLDIGCGTGQLSARIATELPACRVTGCDFSRGMLHQASARSRRVRWVQGDAGSLPFGAAAFDAIVSTEAFHWFPDQDRALAELFRVLVPGGRLLLALINSPSTVVANVMYAGSRLMGEPFYWPTARELGEHVERAGFRVVGRERIFRLPGGLLLPAILTQASRPDNRRSGSAVSR